MHKNSALAIFYVEGQRIITYNSSIPRSDIHDWYIQQDPDDVRLIRSINVEGEGINIYLFDVPEDACGLPFIHEGSDGLYLQLSNNKLVEIYNLYIAEIYNIYVWEDVGELIYSAFDKEASS